MNEHRSYSIEYNAHADRHVAICSCGWRSAPRSTAGMAGSLWDSHVTEEANDAGG